MRDKFRRLGLATAVALAAAMAVPALAHDGDKENAGSEGPTPPGIDSSNFTSHYMTLRSRLDLTQLAAPGADANQNLASAWHWVDPLNNNEYALVCRRSDLAIVNVTDPDNPVLIGNVQRTSGTNATTWRDVRVVGNWAFIGVDAANHGIQSFDLTRVRGVSTPTLFAADAVYTGVTNSHSLGVNLNTPTPYVYAAGSNTMGSATPGGLQVLDVSNPSLITTAASWQSDGYIHESTVFTYNGPDNLQHGGKELVFNGTGYGTDPSGSPNSFSIVDASNKSALTRLGQVQYPDTGYTHQGYLTDDHRFFIINDELDETGHLTGNFTRTHVIDVSDLDNPVYKGFYEWGNGNIDHNLYVVGDFIYQANYTRGIRVFKIDDLDSSNPDDWMHEVAWLDTYPANDGVTFNGVWQVDPFLPSGTIIVSDINGGLFLVNHVPEPGSLALVGLGALALLRRRRA